MPVFRHPASVVALWKERKGKRERKEERKKKKERNSGVAEYRNALWGVQHITVQVTSIKDLEHSALRHQIIR